MKRVLVIAMVALISATEAYAQGGYNLDDCIAFYEKEVGNAKNLSSAYRKSFYFGSYSCLSEAVKKPQYQTAKVYSYFITCCYNNQSWSSGAKAYEAVVEKNLQVDTEVKGMALTCWVNAYDMIMSVDTPILNLADEMVSHDKKWVCLRGRVYAKVANCYDYKRHSGKEHKEDPVVKKQFEDLYVQYVALATEDKNICDNCCIVKHFSEGPGNRGGISSIESK